MSTLRRAHQQLDDAITSLRRLAQGLYPSVLTEYGLTAAVEAMADTAAVPVEVQGPNRRWPQEIEATAYFVVAEAATNAIRHGRATVITVAIADDNEELTLEVRDDGSGGIRTRPGGGLMRLRDRVAAMGGSLRFDSTPADGSVVHLRLPLVDYSN